MVFKLLKLEFKRSLYNKTAFFIFLVHFICFGLGIILPIGMDHIKELTNIDFLFSLYTVYTQFGVMFFCFIGAYILNLDYHNHYTVFYNKFNINLVKNIFNKIVVFFTESIISIVILMLIMGIYFHNFKFMLLFIGLILLILYQDFVFITIVNLFTNNLLILIGISFFCWLFSVALVSLGGIFKYVNVFDASNTNYSLVNDLLLGKYQHLPTIFCQNIIIELLWLTIIFIIVIFIRRKYWKNYI